MLSFHVKFVQRQMDGRTTVKQYASNLSMRGNKNSNYNTLHNPRWSITQECPHKWMDRQAHSSVPLITFLLQGYLQTTNSALVKTEFQFFDKVENFKGKGENAGYQHFLFFPTVFSKGLPRVIKNRNCLV